MLVAAALEFISLFCTGIVAGAWYAVHVGVRAPLRRLDEWPQLQMRQAMIYRLRVAVPAALVPAVLAGAAGALMNGFGPGWAFRCAGVLLLLTCLLTTLAGTVPFNEAVLTWRPGALPRDWRGQADRAERFDAARTWAAVAAFALLLMAMACRLAIR